MYPFRPTKYILGLLFVLTIVSCDPLGRVVRKTVIKYPPNFECIEETLSRIEYIDNLEYRVSQERNDWPTIHTFNYSINFEGEDRFSILGFNLDKENNVEVWHGLMRMAFVSPSEIYIASLRPYWEEIENKIGESCNYKFMDMQEECTFAFCN